jgi:hypothetical protein
MVRSGWFLPIAVMILILVSVVAATAAAQKRQLDDTTYASLTTPIKNPAKY